MNNQLLREFREDEVKKALKQMHPTKSPSPDSMHPIFYQKYWDVVNSNVSHYVLQALNSSIMPDGLNETSICLILKVSAPKR